MAGSSSSDPITICTPTPATEGAGAIRTTGHRTWPTRWASCCASTWTRERRTFLRPTRSRSVTGGYRYRGVRMPSMRGAYFYGDYCSGKIWVARQNSIGGWSSQLLIDTTSSISSFGEDLNGELYMVDLNGKVFAFTEKTN